jgi:hypothetical protein
MAPTEQPAEPDESLRRAQAVAVEYLAMMRRPPEPGVCPTCRGEGDAPCLDCEDEETRQALMDETSDVLQRVRLQNLWAWFEMRRGQP